MGNVQRVRTATIFTLSQILTTEPHHQVNVIEGQSHTGAVLGRIGGIGEGNIQLVVGVIGKCPHGDSGHHRKVDQDPGETQEKGDPIQGVGVGLILLTGPSLQVEGHQKGTTDHIPKVGHIQGVGQGQKEGLPLKVGLRQETGHVQGAGQGGGINILIIMAMVKCRKRDLQTQSVERKLKGDLIAKEKVCLLKRSP